MKEIWMVESKTNNGEWHPHRGYIPMSKEEAHKHATDARFDIVPEYFRIAKYIRDESSFGPKQEGVVLQ